MDIIADTSLMPSSRNSTCAIVCRFFTLWRLFLLSRDFVNHCIIWGAHWLNQGVVLLLYLLTLKKFKHVIVGHWMARFSLVQRVVIALILWRRRWFLHDFRFLLHHYTLGWMAAILLLIGVHTTSGFTIRIAHQWTRLGVVYGLIGCLMLDHRLIIMKCQILLLLTVSTSMSVGS
jgi:hypothetical protein